MSIEKPAPGSASRGELPAGGRRVAHAREKSYLSLVPWRNFRRVLFLILALMAVVALKKSGDRHGRWPRLYGSMYPRASLGSAEPSRPRRRVR